ncbi:MAG: hypothetical protein LBC75_01110 [Fibromonadaceae bacterium]|jgi:hypothetical protein|nr:hypothetical protein [Fibromonadaceae bacterium]
MYKFFKVLSITAFVAVIGFSMSSCATTTIGGASGYHGFFSSLSSPNAATKSAGEIGSYYVILSLFDVGFESYAEKVMAAEKSRGIIITVSRNFLGIINVTTAYETAATQSVDYKPIEW